MGNKFHEFRVTKKYTQKQIIYMAHTLFLTDSQNLNPTKYNPPPSPYGTLPELLFIIMHVCVYNLITYYKYN